MARNGDLPRLTSSGVVIPDAVKRALWMYFDANRDHVVLKVWGFFSVTVGMLEPLFVAIAGPRPSV